MWKVPDGSKTPGADKRVRRIISKYIDVFSTINLRDFALYFDKINASYTYIPKNGSSNIRAALGIANGTISELNPGLVELGIHGSAMLESHLNATKFIVLRNPFQRTISVYLDKIIPIELELFALQSCIRIFKACGSTGLEAEAKIGRGERPSFQQFIYFLKNTPDVRSDPHWRSQCSFFAFMDYDYIFSLELVESQWEHSALAKYSLRDRVNWHRTTRGRLVANSAEDLNLNDVVSHVDGRHIYDLMIEKGIVPSPGLFFAEREIADMFIDRYADDLKLYEHVYPGFIRSHSGIAWRDYRYFVRRGFRAF